MITPFMRIRRGLFGRLVAASALGSVLAAAHVRAAFAVDPGRWVETARKTTSVTYWHGITFDPAARNFYFDGQRCGRRCHPTGAGSGLLAGQA